MEEATTPSSTIYNISKSCSIHGNKISLFCVQHDAIICECCQKESHHKCSPILTIDDASKNVKSSSAMSDVSNRLSNLNCMNDIIDKTCNNISSDLKTKEKEIMNKRKTLRTVINSYLDKIEANLDDDITRMFGEVNERIEKAKTEAKCRQKILKSWQKECSDLRSNATDVHTFLGLKYMDIEMSKEEKAIQENQKECMVPQISFLPSITRENIGMWIPSLGKLVIHETDQSTVTGDKKSQIPVRKKVLHLTNSVTSPELGYSIRFRRACFLPDNKLLVTAFTDNTVLLCRKDGTNVRRFDLNFYPEDVTLFDQTRAVVAGGSCMQIVTVPSYTLKKPIKLDFNPTSIYSGNGEIFVKEGYNRIKLLNIKGEIQKTITTQSGIWDFCYSVTSDTLFWSLLGWSSRSVYCLHEGEEKELYRSSDLRYPWGITVDKKDNVYVTGNGSDNIHKISGSGKADVIGITGGDISKPTMLAYNQQTDEILLVHKNNSELRVYSIM